MKKLLMMICLAGLALFYVQADNVPLKGELDGSGGMKNPTTPVKAFQNPYSLELNFLCNLGELYIEVYDETGAPVFQTAVKAAAGSDLSIDTNAWESGEYTLVISDKSGGSLEGKFKID
jgi:hypothetical protein